jgi:hypothetical protein
VLFGWLSNRDYEDALRKLMFKKIKRFFWLFLELLKDMPMEDFDRERASLSMERRIRREKDD